ncbi:DoxX family protein [Jhaorihella thermophila]|uniref:Putative oxidoreductase n=1 Tax=Jhaorihella thermophila TaxID=488547 RepID=A0A1H5SP73_9RHOB|nr:DoxX family protein [Jhaorihella thermophila]SEF52412.1 putative oxidoreductase [Jhaorihella thermophila]
MDSFRDTGLLAARVLLAVLFIVAGIGKLGNVEGFTAYMASGGVPAFMAWPVIALEILGGLALLAGWQTRWAALALGAFSLAAGLLYHLIPADQMQMTMFFKNVGLAGGYLALAVAGPGRFSVDARTGREAAAAA